MISCQRKIRPKLKGLPRRINRRIPHLQSFRDVLGYSNTRGTDNGIGLSSGSEVVEQEATGAGETRFRWNAGRNRFVTGAEYTIEHVNTANAQGVQTLPAKPVLTSRGAFFGQWDRTVTEKLSLELSGRLDASTLHSPQFSPHAAAVYELSPYHSLRASYNEGFEVASHVELFLDRQIGLPINLSAIERALTPLSGALRSVCRACPSLLSATRI